METHRDSIVFSNRVSQWMSWNALQSFARLKEIKSVLSHFLAHIELLACSEVQYGNHGFSAWSKLIRYAMRFDIQDMEKGLLILVNNKNIVDEIDNGLCRDEVDTMMDVLQSVGHIAIPLFTIILLKASLDDRQTCCFSPTIRTSTEENRAEDWFLTAIYFSICRETHWHEPGRRWWLCGYMERNCTGQASSTQSPPDI